MLTFAEPRKPLRQIVVVLPQVAGAAPKVKNLADESADLTATVVGSANGPLRPGVLGV
jgi:hypothetical protein